MPDSNLLSKQRNYSFLHKNDEMLDAVEDEASKTVFVIPAQPGSCYWAILKIGYLHHDRPIKLSDYIAQIAELMEERSPVKWTNFKNKKTIKTVKNGEVVEKTANDWRKRIETNIKTLTRDGGSNPYGNRLRERGHILCWEPKYSPTEGAFILRTDSNRLPDGTKKD